MINTILILQNGPTVLGVYTTPTRIVEAQADWNDEFMRRFGRMPKPWELPVVVTLRVDGRQGDSVVPNVDAN